jgi:hypothetical protein
VVFDFEFVSRFHGILLDRFHLVSPFYSMQ